MRLTIMILCLCVLGLGAQIPTVQWAKHLEGSAADVAESVASDATGNVYVTGVFEGTIDLDPGPATLSFQAAGGVDLFVIKLDPAGNLLWARTMGGSQSDRPGALAVTPTGSVFIAGSFDSPDADFDPSSASYTMDAGAAEDGFIVKLDPSGNFVWARQMGGLPGEQTTDDLAITDVELSSGSTVYLTGYFSGAADLDPGPTTSPATANGSTDMFIVTLTDQGALVNAIQLGGEGRELARSIKVDNAGNMHLSGSFTGVSDFDPGVASFTVDAGTEPAGFVVKLAPAGNLLWARNTDGPGYYDYTGTDLDAAGNIFLVGSFFGTVDADPGPGSVTLTTTGFFGSTDITVTKLDANGNTQWISQFGDPDDPDRASSIAVGSDGKIYVSGSFEGDASDFDPGPGTHTLSSNGSEDVVLFRLNANGSLDWVFSFGGASQESTGGMALDPQQNILLAGHFASQGLDFDPGAGSTIYSATGSDGFVMKLRKDCSALAATISASGDTLVASIPNATYQWYDCRYGSIVSAETSAKFVPSEDGQYAVIVDKDGCRDTSECYVFVRSDLREPFSSEAFSVWPNPAVSSFLVKSDLETEIRLFNGNGQLLQTFELKQENQYRLVVDGLRPGLYLLVTNEGNIRRVIVQTM